MISILLGAIITISCIYGFLNGNADELSNAVITSGQTAVELVLTIIGSMATWGGVMKIAQKSGITDKVTKLISPFLKLIFKGLDTGSEAFKAIAMNTAANLFGLGNAATPLGISAMRELEKLEGEKSYATKNMMLLAVLNTSSIELIPTTVATLRLAHGSVSPLEILPCVLAVSILSLTTSILCVYAFDGIISIKRHRQRQAKKND